MKYLFSVSTSCYEYVSQGHTSFSIKNIQDISYKKSEINNNANTYWVAAKIRIKFMWWKLMFRLCFIYVIFE